MVSQVIQEARDKQIRLAKYVDLSSFKGNHDLIAGADISFNLGDDVVFAAIVVLSLKSAEVLEKVHVAERIAFPYIPGYLSFREVPPLLLAWDKLKNKPGIVILDGHGLIHPRRFGLACHFGLEAKVATMGCAKKPFVGNFDMPGEERGSFTPVTVDGEVRGFAYRSRVKVKPVYISPGTGMSLMDCLQFAQLSTGKYRLLEPTRQAHMYSNEMRALQCTG